MARISGNSDTKTYTPKVELITATNNPIGTLASIWIGSRYEISISAKDIEDVYYDRSNDLEVINRLCDYYPEYAGDNKDYKNVIRNIVKLVIKSNLPPLDAINFTFSIDNATIAFREQLVRGRQPQNFWTQTSRTADLSKFNANQSENIEYYGGKNAVDIYKSALDSIRKAYSDLAQLGVPIEDIRLIPQSMIHRIVWMVPYRTLQTALSKRMSWIAQTSLWTPIIEGIQIELFKYCPLIADCLGTPADVLISEGKIVKHTYDNENEDRYFNKDPQPCDPLWLAYRGLTLPSHTDMKFYNRMKQYYIKLWSTEICDILGWDKSNPEAIGKFDEPKLN